MLLDALMQEDEESVIDYAKLKEKARQRNLASMRKNLPLGRKHQQQQLDNGSITNTICMYVILGESTDS